MSSAESEYRTVADAAMQEASSAASLTKRFLFTGRVLVKATYENLELPASTDADEAVQFYAPELRKVAKPFVRLAAAGFREPGSAPKLLLNRTLTTNKQAKLEPDNFVIYTAEGRVEPGSLL